MPLWPQIEIVPTMLVLAPIIGSFGGVLVRRLAHALPVVFDRSACEACDHALGVRDLVPLLSFAALRGRCRHCGAPIPWMHPAIELASLAVAASAAIVDGGDPDRFFAGCVLGWALLVLAWIDWTALLLPDVLTLPLVLLGLSFVAVLEPDALANHAAAAIAGYLAFAAIAAYYRWRRGRDGMGGGDAKLMAAAGAWLGLSGLAPVMAGGAMLGLAWAGLFAWTTCRGWNRTGVRTVARPGNLVHLVVSGRVVRRRLVAKRIAPPASSRRFDSRSRSLTWARTPAPFLSHQTV